MKVTPGKPTVTIELLPHEAQVLTKYLCLDATECREARMTDKSETLYDLLAKLGNLGYER